MTLIKSLRSLAGLLRYLTSNALDLVLVLVVVPTVLPVAPLSLSGSVSVPSPLSYSFMWDVPVRLCGFVAMLEAAHCFHMGAVCTPGGSLSLCS